MSRPWVAGVFLASSVPQFPQLCGAVMRRAYSLEFSEGQTRMAPAGFLHGVLRGSDLTGRRGLDRDLHLLFPERTLALGTSEPRPPHRLPGSVWAWGQHLGILGCGGGPARSGLRPDLGRPSRPSVWARCCLVTCRGRGWWCLPGWPFPVLSHCRPRPAGWAGWEVQAFQQGREPPGPRATLLPGGPRHPRLPLLYSPWERAWRRCPGSARHVLSRDR